MNKFKQPSSCIRLGFVQILRLYQQKGSKNMPVSKAAKAENSNEMSEASDHGAIAAVKDVARETGQKLRLAMNETADKAVQVRTDVEKQVKHNPLKSLAIAAGAGVLLGFLFGNRRK